MKHPPTKILVAYDGSESARAAPHDLLRAGLADRPEVLVVAVGEEHSEAVETAGAGAQLLQSECPEWNIRFEGLIGSPTRVLIEMADSWKPDLLVAGSHGRTAFGRFLLGSVSHKLATEAHCSVRIVRRTEHPRAGPPRIVVGVDGSAGATAAVREVGSRCWPAETSVVVVIAVEGTQDALDNGEYHEYAAMQFAEWRARQKVHASRAANAAVESLRAVGAKVDSIVGQGSPRSLILQTAERLDADCIFLGAAGASDTEASQVGGVSATVLLQAHCSVEIVRQQKAREP